MIKHFFTRLMFIGTESEMTTEFIKNPAIGTLYWSTDNLKLYVFTLTGWELASVADGLYVLKTGDTMTGTLNMEYNVVSQNGGNAIFINTLWDTESNSPSDPHSGLYILAYHQGTEDQSPGGASGLHGIYSSCIGLGAGSIPITNIILQSGEATDVHSSEIVDIFIQSPSVNDYGLTPYTALKIGADNGYAIITGTAKTLLGGETTIDDALIVGAPTGGNMGVGTINVEGGIYQNGTLYINPDYVFEKWATGKIVKNAHKPGANIYVERSLSSLRQYIKDNYFLPNTHTPERDLFGTVQWLTEQLEIAYTHILDMDVRVSQLEKYVMNQLNKGQK